MLDLDPVRVSVYSSFKQPSEKKHSYVESLNMRNDSA